MGIRMKSILIMGILGLLAITAIGAISYQLSIANALNEAKIKSKIILNYAMATKSFTGQVQRPLVAQLVDKDFFDPELMSGFAAAKETFDIFKKSSPGYVFKQASLDPLNLENRADTDEIKIIKYFDNNPEMKSSEGQLTKNGAEVFYFAQPIKVSSVGCLTCHGDPKDAPQEQIDLYGTENGYHWPLNKTISAFVVYIPTATAIASARQISTTLVLISAGGILLTLIILWFFLNRTVVLPIIHLSERTESFSMGDNLDEPIVGESKDEIGTLAQSIERLRISLAKLLQ